MKKSLEELGINTDGLLESKSKVIFILKSGAQASVSTPLSAEDVMMLWNAHKLNLKIPADDGSYFAIRKNRVDCLHVITAKNAS